MVILQFTRYLGTLLGGFASFEVRAIGLSSVFF